MINSFRIIVRTEFDCENLSLRSPLEFLNEFKKYRKLMQLTFSLICERLGETKPLPATTSFSYQMVCSIKLEMFICS